MTDWRYFSPSSVSEHIIEADTWWLPTRRSAYLQVKVHAYMMSAELQPLCCTQPLSVCVHSCSQKPEVVCRESSLITSGKLIMKTRCARRRRISTSVRFGASAFKTRVVYKPLLIIPTSLSRYFLITVSRAWSELGRWLRSLHDYLTFSLLRFIMFHNEGSLVIWWWASNMSAMLDLLISVGTPSAELHKHWDNPKKHLAAACRMWWVSTSGTHFHPDLIQIQMQTDVVVV